MDEWAEDFRSADLDTIIGQSDAVYDIQGFLRRGERRNLILTGPSGIGKTTVARSYAKALFCPQSKTLGKACGECKTCKAFDLNATPAFLYTNGGLLNIQVAQDWMSRVQAISPIFSNQYVYHIDEARCLDPDVRDLLVTEMERPTSPAVFIFTLLVANDLPEPMRGRCAVVHLSRPSLGDRSQYLSLLAQKKGVTINAVTLNLLATTAADFRTVAQHLQLVAGVGQVDEVSVAKRFAPDAQMAWRFLVSALRGAPDTMISELTTSATSPSVLSQTLEALLIDASLTVASGLKVQAAMQVDVASLDIEQRLDLARALEPIVHSSAGDDQLAAGRLWQFWSATAPGLPPQRLAAALLDFRELAAERPSVSRSGRARPIASRSAALKVEESALRVAQTGEIYEAASFMVQAYGVGMNFRLSLTSSASGLEHDVQAVAQAGALINQLGARLKTWCGPSHGRLHYISLHRRSASGGLNTVSFIHVPEVVHEKAAAWLETRLDGRVDGLIGEAQGMDLDGHGKGLMRLHWQLARELWTGVSQTACLPTGELLIDRLKVVKSDRNGVGAVQCRRYTTSTSISAGARRDAQLDRMGHLSAFADGAWDWLFRGWEIWEHENRRHVSLERAQQVAELRTRVPGSDDYERQAFEVRLSRLRAGWPADPRRRSRTWKTWFDGKEVNGKSHENFNKNIDI